MPGNCNISSVHPEAITPQGSAIRTSGRAGVHRTTAAPGRELVVGLLGVVRQSACGRDSETCAGRADELVADVTHRADHLLVLGAELGPQPPHVDVDRARATEEV